MACEPPSSSLPPLHTSAPASGGSRRPRPFPFLHPPGSAVVAAPRQRGRRSIQRLFATLLCLVLVSGFIGNLPVVAATVFAAGLGTPPSAHLTLKQFLAQGRPDKVYRGPLIRPPDPTPPHNPKDKHTDYSHLPPSTEPVTMQPIAQPVDRS